MKTKLFTKVASTIVAGALAASMVPAMAFAATASDESLATKSAYPALDAYDLLPGKVTGKPTIKSAAVAPTQDKASDYENTNVKLSWTACEFTDELGEKTTDADHISYEIQHKASGSSKWTTVTSVKGAKTSATIQDKSDGKSYTYRIRGCIRYLVKDPKSQLGYSLKNAYGSYSAASKSVKMAPAAPKSLKATPQSALKVKLTWKKTSGVKGYLIYRSTTEGKNYKLVKTVANASATSCIDAKSLKNGTTYYYRVHAYTLSGTTKRIGAFDSVEVTTVPAKTAITSISKKWNSKKTKATVTIKWTAKKGADGYAIQRSTKKSSGFKTIATNLNFLKDGVTLKDNTVQKGKTYYYRVIAFNDAKASASAAKAITIK